MIILTLLRSLCSSRLTSFPWWMENNEKKQVVDIIPFVHIFKTNQIVLDTYPWAFS